MKNKEIDKKYSLDITIFKKKEIKNEENFYKFIEIKYPSLGLFIKKYNEINNKAWIYLDHLSVEENEDQIKIKAELIENELETLFKKDEYRKNFIEEFDELVLQIKNIFDSMPNAKLYDDTFTEDQIKKINEVNNEFIKDKKMSIIMSRS